MTEESGASTITKIAEGIWLSPGQVPRSLSFVKVVTDKNRTQHKVIFNNIPDDVFLSWPTISSKAHGSHAIVEIKGGGTMLHVLFHSSGVNCWQLKSKLLNSVGFGVWQAQDYGEKFVLTSVHGDNSSDMFNSNVNTRHSTDEMLAELKMKSDGVWDLRDTKFVLKWCHPGSAHAYVLCQKNLKIIFVSNTGGFSSEHGLWAYNVADNALFTHFHHRGHIDEDGNPKAPATYLTRLETDTSESFIATGESSPPFKKIRIYGPNEQQHIGKWHIFAQIVWRDQTCEQASA